jgi:hypothetical protein
MPDYEKCQTSGHRIGTKAAYHVCLVQLTQEGQCDMSNLFTPKSDLRSNGKILPGEVKALHHASNTQGTQEQEKGITDDRPARLVGPGRSSRNDSDFACVHFAAKIAFLRPHAQLKRRTQVYDDAVMIRGWYYYLVQAMTHVNETNIPPRQGFARGNDSLGIQPCDRLRN